MFSNEPRRRPVGLLWHTRLGLRLGPGVRGIHIQAWNSASFANRPYKVLLANGSIIQADLTQNADLFRSLKGGGSNFGIITKFRVEASDLQDVDTMSMAYRWQDLPKVMQAAAHFNDVARSDPGAAVILSIGIESTGHPPPITAFMTHPSNILDSPPLQELLAVDSQSYYHQRLTLTQLSEKLDLDNPAGFRYYLWTPQTAPNPTR